MEVHMRIINDYALYLILAVFLSGMFLGNEHGVKIQAGRDSNLAVSEYKNGLRDGMKQEAKLHNKLREIIVPADLPENVIPRLSRR